MGGPPETAVQQAGWAGALTMTRELTPSAAGHLISKPVAETTVLHKAHSRETLTSQSPSLTLPSEPVDIVADLHTTHGGQVRLELAETMALELDLVNCTAHVAKNVYEESRREWVTRATFPPSGNHRQLRILIDGSIVEVFVNYGPTFTERLAQQAPDPSDARRRRRNARWSFAAWSLLPPRLHSPPRGPAARRGREGALVSQTSVRSRVTRVTQTGSSSREILDHNAAVMIHPVDRLTKSAPQADPVAGTSRVARELRLRGHPSRFDD